MWTARPELPGFEELRTSLEGASCAASGLEPDRITEAAETLAGSGPLVVMFGLGVMQQAGSTQIIKGLANVATLLGGSVMPLRGQNNAQGASDLGLACEYLPGYAAIADADARKKWESAWNCKLPESPGMNATDMVRACATGGIKTLLVFGDNVALSSPSSKESLAALDKAEVSGGLRAVSDGNRADGRRRLPRLLVFGKRRHVHQH